MAKKMAPAARHSIHGIHGMHYSRGDYSPRRYGVERIEKIVLKRTPEITPCMPLCSFERKCSAQVEKRGLPQRAFQTSLCCTSEQLSQSLRHHPS